MFQTVGNHVELECANRAKNHVGAGNRAEQLGRPLLGQLLQAFLQLLDLQRVADTRQAEHFRCEGRNAGKAQVFALGEGLAEADGAVVGDADDVARPRLIGSGAIARHEGNGVVDRQGLAGGHLLDLHAPVEAAGTDAQEGDAVAVLGVHVGLDLEHEA
ncbi:hypothetical protein SDC9_165113 [bioreactor metagenome]|uniref:Uncharacterized protein n=1 Tax=bioreactor metagenome TaxID=1076179 RepID=A0A645FTH4_9ZZZZ